MQTVLVKSSPGECARFVRSANQGPSHLSSSSQMLALYSVVDIRTGGRGSLLHIQVGVSPFHDVGMCYTSCVLWHRLSIDKCGDVSYRHEVNPGWEINTFIQQQVQQGKTCRDLYWL